MIKELTPWLQQLNLQVDTSMQEKQLDFLSLLQKWNQAYNLTAIKSFNDMLIYHLLDSLSIVPYLEGDKILDIGTGAGFPGVPLAIYFSNKNFTLCDSNGKKIRFLTQAKAELSLNNIVCVQSRMQSFNSDTLFDTIICRAVGDMKTITQNSRHLLKKGGQWLFMKGGHFAHELDQVKQPYSIIELKVPNLDEQRHLIVIRLECSHSRG